MPPWLGYHFPLCACLNAYENSHHLLFDCAFSRALVLLAGVFLGFHFDGRIEGLVPESLGLCDTQLRWKALLSLAAVVYFLWQERNARLFDPHHRRTV